MTDPLTPDERSARMSKVRGIGNRSTEGRVEQVLLEAGLEGWKKHPKEILGKPDFFFPRYRLVVFVDGCFWHACPICKRRIPSNRSEFWRDKLDTNRRRDNRVHRRLRKEGYHVMRIWEHDLKKEVWLKRLLAMIRRVETRQVVANREWNAEGTDESASENAAKRGDRSR